MTDRQEAGSTPAKRRRSGPSIPEAQRKTVKLQLRVAPAVIGQLDALAKAQGVTRSSAVSQAIATRLEWRRALDQLMGGK